MRHDLFHKDLIESGTTDGLRILKMLSTNTDGKPKGKIHCLYNGYDYALQASNIANWKERMGAVGIGSYDHWGWGWTFDEAKLLHPDIVGHAVNYNAGKQLGWLEYKAHGYQFNQFAIDYYKSFIE